MVQSEMTPHDPDIGDDRRPTLNNARRPSLVNVDRVADRSHLDDWSATILDSVADGVFTIDSEWRITSFNKAAEEITGISREEAVGRSCFHVFRADICESVCALRETAETGRAVVNRPTYIRTARGKRIPISISAALLRT